MPTGEKYHRVNAAWPEGTRDGRDLKPTPQEAITAARKLYRFALKKTFTGKVKLTSGNRYTWIRNKTLFVNPDLNGGGWHELVHCMSHYCAYKLHPGAPAHGTQHHWLEKTMIEYVVSKGWHEGALKRPVKEAEDPRIKRRDQVLAGIARWKAKQKRAENALRKLERRRRYYDKALAA